MLATLRAQVAEARAWESIEETRVENAERLAKQNVVSPEEVGLHRDERDAAKARRTAAESKVVEGEAQVQLEEARLELAKLEVEAAEARLKPLEPSPERERYEAEGSTSTFPDFPTALRSAQLDIAPRSTSIPVSGARPR